MTARSVPARTAPNAPQSKALVLFDIDGTILRRAGPHHRQSLATAIRKVTGVEATAEGVPVAGMLDRDIIAAMLRNAGVPERTIRQSMPEIVQHAQKTYARICPDLRGRVCPGVRLLLYRLSRRHVPAALVTGNLTRIGWTKMQRAGLRQYFKFGAFAELADTRAGLVRIALDHAFKQGWIDARSPVTLIGDHPNDIRAAKANGVRAVSVATGLIGADELSRHSPDILVPDLRALEWKRLLAWDCRAPFNSRV